MTISEWLSTATLVWTILAALSVGLVGILKLVWDQGNEIKLLIKQHAEIKAEIKSMDESKASTEKDVTGLASEVKLLESDVKGVKADVTALKEDARAIGSVMQEHRIIMAVHAEIVTRLEKAIEKLTQ